MENSNEQNDRFVRQTIRKKPVNKGKILKRIMATIVLAVVFGAIACVTFFVMEPILNGVVKPDRIARISFPEEDIPVENLLTEESKAQKEQENKEEALEAARQEAAREIARETIVEESEESGLKALSQAYEEMSLLAKEAQSCLVTVVATNSAQDWLLGPYEEKQSFTGVIVADNTQDLIILADLEDREGSSYTVFFNDGYFVESQMLRRDEYTGLAIFTVPMNQIPYSSREEMSIASLGSSYTALLGSPVIAIGSPQGVSSSVSYGIITSNNLQLQATDANYGVIYTDISGPEDASGVLINLDGSVVGMIDKKAKQLTSSEEIAAIGISEIKGLIAKLSNDEDRAYFGVKGTGVTQQVHDQLSLPFGAFVTEVEPDSPAMQAGIRNGDIIVKIGEETVSSFRELRTVLLTLEPSEIENVLIMRSNGDEYEEMQVEVLFGNAGQ